MILTETSQVVTGFPQQCFSYIVPPLLEIEMANHTDVRIVVLLTDFIASEIRLPILNKTHYPITL
jgi:hypothetical protein